MRQHPFRNERKSLCVKKNPSCVAAVDLGSNSFHMIVCSLNNGKLQTIDRLKEMVRLASGLDKKTTLIWKLKIVRLSV
jgi:hypothetical protein